MGPRLRHRSVVRPADINLSQESGQQRPDLSGGQQDAIVPVRALDHMVVAATTCRTDGISNGRLLGGRIQHVGTDAQRHGGKVRQAPDRGLHGSPVTRQVVQVHGPVQDQVAIGVEPADQLLTVVVEVGLHLEPVPVAEDRPGVHQLTGEPVVEHLGAAVGDLGHRPGDRQASERTVAGLGVVVVATPEPRIQRKGSSTHGAPRHLLGAGSQRRGDRGDGTHPVGEHDAPLQDLHPTHGTAYDGHP